MVREFASAVQLPLPLTRMRVRGFWAITGRPLLGYSSLAARVVIRKRYTPLLQPSEQRQGG